ncbi:MAG TPA: hypothetical protein VJ624_11990, partial [Thermodesulfobacteriota bacterium]|nr:hypothetical protein [Thermodesulfobacteriota bacterium]
MVRNNAILKKKLSTNIASSNQKKTGKPSSVDGFTPLEKTRAEVRNKIKNAYAFSHKVDAPCESLLTGFTDEWATKGLSRRVIRKFQKIILQRYEKHARVFSWRQTRDPYQIFVSEIMLQQTPVDRVIEKY